MSRLGIKLHNLYCLHSCMSRSFVQMFIQLVNSLETFDCLVTQEMVMELWRSTPVGVVGREYVQIAPGLTVMQLLSARTWDMPVELLYHLSLLAVVPPLGPLLVNFMLPAVHPELGIQLFLVCVPSRLYLQPQIVSQISLLLSDAVSSILTSCNNI